MSSKRHKTRKALLIIGCLLACIMAGLLVMNIWTRSQLNNHLEALREAGEPVTLQELAALQKRIPDEQNSFALLSELFPRLEQLSNNPDNDTVPLIGNADLPEWPQPLSPAMRDTVGSFLREHDTLINDLEVVRNIFEGRVYPDPTIRTSDRLLDEFLPSVRGYRNAAKLTVLQALFDASEGRTTKGVEDCDLLFNITAAVTDAPIIITALAGLGNQEFAIAMIERILAYHELDFDKVQHLQKQLQQAAERSEDRMVWAFRGERVNISEQFNCFRRSALTWIATQQHQVSYYSILLSLVSGWINVDQKRSLRMIDELVEWARPGTLAKNHPSGDWEQRVSALSDSFILSKIFLPGLSRVIYLNDAGRARIQCAVVALGCEKYRLAHGQWPDRLETIVPDDLSALPIDTFNGQILSYKRHDNHITVYSVGRNLKDDGGELGRQPNAPPPDIGFRLLDPEQRSRR